MSLNDDNLNSIIEERADFLKEDELKKCTVKDGDFFKKIYDALISRGTKLIIGPRGCGKTHLMRYAWLDCKNDKEKPLAIYVSFNRYFRLEPLLKSKPNAIALFNSWTLAKILIAANEVAYEIAPDKNLDLSKILISDKDRLDKLVGRLEQSLSPTSEQELIVEKLSVSAITYVLHDLADYLGRKRVVIFLDDAAITLTPEYLYEFFDIIRTLKTSRISLKASVYPGTTEYGPKFHVAHEAESIDAWLSIDSEDYSIIMESIADKRFSEHKNIPSEMSELLKYAAFGVPRSYLMMLREYVKDSSKGTQQKFNKLIEKYTSDRISEYRSLRIKLPRLENIINIGVTLLTKIIILIKQANSPLYETSGKQTTVGILKEKEDNLLFNRMINLLMEVGLLFQLPPVSHGEDRSYSRYIPHYALMIKERVFNKGSQGFSVQEIIRYINRKSLKHPVRKTAKTLLGDELFSQLQLKLPPCKKCATQRISDNQKFCHNCGNPLVDESTFNKCMSLNLNKIPRITEWQSKEIKNLKNIKTVGDFLSLQDPGTELRKIRLIGQKRADKIIRNIMLYIDEFLS